MAFWEHALWHFAKWEVTAFCLCWRGRSLCHVCLYKIAHLLEKAVVVCLPEADVPVPGVIDGRSREALLSAAVANLAENIAF